MKKISKIAAAAVAVTLGAVGETFAQSTNPGEAITAVGTQLDAFGATVIDAGIDNTFSIATWAVPLALAVGVVGTLLGLLGRRRVV